MLLQNIIKQDLVNVKRSKTRNIELKTALEIVVGEMQRQKVKELSNKAVLKILKLLEKNEALCLKKMSRDRSTLLEIVKEYQAMELVDEN